MTIAYFVHNLVDPAVARRIHVLRRGGAQIDLYGFRRTPQAPAMVAGVVAHDLGRTDDARLASRAASVLWRMATAPFWARSLAGAEVIVARNLEMLAIAAAARRLYAPQARLIYELLDVHRLLASDGRAARTLRWIEARLLRGCDGILISSPAFETQYLRRRHASLPPVRLAENKVMPGHADPQAPVAPRPDALPPGPPWRIGWFGVIRCARSLALFAALARRHPGLIEVDIRGTVSPNLAGQFQASVDGAPGLTYHGRYKNPDDLAAIYGAVHFAWTMDFYEAGLNSAWLLPNRLYEGGACQSVPIAATATATADWLDRHSLGFRLDEPLEAAAEQFFATLTPDRFAAATAASHAAPPELFLWNDAECAELAAWVAGNPPRPVAA